MRIGYEGTIQKLNSDLGLPPVPFVTKPVSGGGGGGGPGCPTSPVRSFGQAKHKIQ